jgi:hypothetical protein
MANVKSRGARHRREPLPERFGSVEEAGEFWDTHDSADYEEDMVDVDCDVNIKRRVYLVSLESDLYRRLRAIAKARGVKTETLVNLWIQEKAS